MPCVTLSDGFLQNIRPMEGTMPRITATSQQIGSRNKYRQNELTVEVWAPIEPPVPGSAAWAAVANRYAAGPGRTQPHCASTCSPNETVPCAFFDGRLHCRQVRIQQCRISDLDDRNRLHHARLADGSIGSLQVAGLHCIQGVFETVANVHFKQGLGLSRIPCKSGIERIPVFLHLWLR